MSQLGTRLQVDSLQLHAPFDHKDWECHGMSRVSLDGVCFEDVWRYSEIVLTPEADRDIMVGVGGLYRWLYRSPDGLGLQFASTCWERSSEVGSLVLLPVSWSS